MPPVPPLWAPTPGELTVAALGWLLVGLWRAISSPWVQGFGLGLLVSWCAG